jgi:Cu(I)/Ag(I) efflux system membrane protein CusA/SilA
MARRYDGGQADRRNGPGGADPGRFERLDHADQARIDMLATGIRTPIGIRSSARVLTEIEKLAKAIEAVVKTVPGTTSAYAERVTGGYYLDIEPDRMALARYAWRGRELAGRDRHRPGGEMVTTTVEGLGATRQRALSARTAAGPSGHRQPGAGADHGGAMIPLGQVARVSLMQAPPAIRTRERFYSRRTFLWISAVADIGGYVSDAQTAVREQVQFPAGLLCHLGGQFEYMERRESKACLVVPAHAA